MIPSLCNIKFLCAGGDPNFVGSVAIALVFVTAFFALVAIFMQGPAGKVISVIISIVILISIWSAVLDI